jgi:pantoate--beta-alanine ligase
MALWRCRVGKDGELAWRFVEPGELQAGIVLGAFGRLVGQRVEGTVLLKKLPHRQAHAKLLLQCIPDIAVFGEKDYQQLLVIRRLVRDLNMQVEIVGGPIVREGDGLALSSRNAYLLAEERKTAPLLYKTVHDVAAVLAQGEGADAAAEAGRFKLEAAGFRVDYVAVRDPDTLKPLSGPVKPGTRVLAAAYLGKTRLIDNVAVPPKA